MGCCFLKQPKDFLEPSPAQQEHIPQQNSQNSFVSMNNNNAIRSLLPISGFCSFVNKSNANIYSFSLDYEILEDKLLKSLLYDIQPAIHKHTGILVNVMIIPSDLFRIWCPDKNFEVFQSIDHPNILKIFDKYSQEETTYIIKEELLGKPLLGSFIEHFKKGAVFNEVFLQNIFQQLFSALDVLHAKGIIYMYLTAYNIVCESDLFRVKLEDFLTISIANKTENSYKYGNLHYMAPELLSVIENSKQFTEKVDLWAAGVLLFLLLSGKYPFSGENGKEISADIIEKKLELTKFFPFASSALINLLERLLEKDPKKRISAKEAVNHFWFKEKSTENLKLNYKGLKKIYFDEGSKRVKASFLCNILLNALEKKEFLIFYSSSARKRTFDNIKHRLLKENEIKSISEEIKILEKEFKLLNIWDFFCFLYGKRFFTSEKIQKIFDELDFERKGTINLEWIINKSQGGLQNLQIWKYLFEEKLNIEWSKEINALGFEKLYLNLMTKDL